jgi:hypothetical protein
MACDELSFMMGVFALKREIDDFIADKLGGERSDVFSKGQDDGLRWVQDHLEYILSK